MLRVVRTYDMRLADNILTNPVILSTITEDGTIYKYPSIRNSHIYLTSFLDNKPIGLTILHPNKYKQWQVHIQVLPEYREKYGIAFGKACIAWGWDYGIDTCYATIPVIYPNVKAFAELLGFKQVDVLPKSYMKNGRLVDKWVIRLDRYI